MQHDNMTKKDFFAEQQGGKSFVRAKNDWFGIGKIHLSFVSHNGDKQNCVAVDSTEAALDFPEALAFTQLVLTGGAKKMSDIARKEQQAHGSQYANDIWFSQGGSSRNGAVEWRQVSLTPSSRGDGFVLSCRKAEGEANSMGGISKKAGAKESRIMVLFGVLDLVGFAKLMEIEITAYKTAVMSGKAPELRTWVNGAPVASNTNPAPSKQELKEKPVEIKTVYVIYDTKGLSFEVAGTPGKAVELLRSAVLALHNSKEKYRNNDAAKFADLVNAIETGEEIPDFFLKAKEKPADVVGIAVARKEVLV